MPSYRTELVIKAVIGKYTDWVKRFDIAEYVQNPPLIEKLHEEKQLALVRTIELENQVHDLEQNLHTLELKNQALEIGTSDAKRKSRSAFFLSLIATVLISMGINIATSSPNNWIGWTIIVAGCVIEVIAFFIKP